MLVGAKKKKQQHGIVSVFSYFRLLDVLHSAYRIMQLSTAANAVEPGPCPACHSSLECHAGKSFLSVAVDTSKCCCVCFTNIVWMYTGVV